MGKKSTVVVFLVFLAFAAACGSGGENGSGADDPSGSGADGVVLDASGLMAQLRAAGATVEPAGTFASSALTGATQVIRVNGVDVQLYEYATTAEAEMEAAYVSPDGGSFETPGSVTMANWVATPHFFLGGRLIVQYIGDDPGVIALLESLLGPQFAGGMGESQPRLKVEIVEPVEGAPTIFEEAAGQAQSVVLAQVMSVEQGPNYVANVEPLGCRPSQLITVQILEVYKGASVPGREELIYQEAGMTDEGTGCGEDPSAEQVVLIMDHDPLYDVGQYYLLAFSPLANSLDPDPAITAANPDLIKLVETLNPGLVLFNGRLLVEQGGHAQLEQADVVSAAHDDYGRAIAGPSTGKSLADYAALLRQALPQIAVPGSTSATTVQGGQTIFGWLRSFDGSSSGTVTVGVDQAEMLTGEEAAAAARQDGVIGAGEDLPNDFYIRNPDESTVELTVSPEAVVTLQACYQAGDCVTTEQVDLETWSVLLGAEDDPGLEWDWYGAGSLPYEFTVKNDVIIAIQEQYLP